MDHYVTYSKSYYTVGVILQGKTRILYHYHSHVRCRYKLSALCSLAR